MRPVATDIAIARSVVCLSVCVSVFLSFVSAAETVELIEMPFARIRLT